MVNCIDNRKQGEGSGGHRVTAGRKGGRSAYDWNAYKKRIPKKLKKLRLKELVI